MADQALRVLAAAGRAWNQMPSSQEPDFLEQDLCFLGLCGMIDPVRPEVVDAIRECRGAGIRPVMITGDHKDTAVAIAKELGILEAGRKAVTGAEIDQLSDEELDRRIEEYAVYARVQPEHKVRIVDAWKRKGRITAMTGDGVNDAPSIKRADIGIGMGITGTDVTKNVADMVLADDNFATIVSAVREGRTVYGNIRKTIHFLMSCNIGEILVVLVSFLLRTPTPLLPAQLLWVNLVTDSLPALALGSDPPQGDVMRRPPTARDSSAFSNGLGFAMAAEGMMIGALALLAFTVGRVFFDADPMQPAVGRTMAFAVLSLSQLVHSYNMRSTGPVLGRGMFKNRGLNISFLICSAWMAGVVVFPQAAALFGSVPLTLTQWGIVAILALLPLPICEMQKRILSRTAKVKNMTSGVKKRVIFNK
jgi:Ca2+-transporting ATPase